MTSNTISNNLKLRKTLMKNRFIIAALFILAGLLVILIPTVLFPVCESEMKMACYYTKQAEIGVGAVILLLGIVSALFSDKKTRSGISIAQFLNGALVLALPFKLTGLCKMSDMACKAKTQPALIVIGVLILVIAGVNFGYLAATGSKDD